MMNTLIHPEPISGAPYSAVELMPSDDRVVMLDQRQLPTRELYIELTEVDQVARAIADMVVRGAPAIGIAAAYAMVLAARQATGDVVEELRRAGEQLRAARPTAVNLAWAVERMVRVVEAEPGLRATSQVERLAQAARRIHADDVQANRFMGRLGAERVPDGATILTHCNAGALATGGYGTALGVIRAAHEAGKRIRVLADETRPYLQGSRLTAWELQRDGIDVQLITDGSSGSLFRAGRIDLVVVGSDRIAANGDVANKIGTYTLACLARQHERPFFVAAPWSTVDVRCPGGAEIPIEQRDAREITHLGTPSGDVQLAPSGVAAYNPAFDVTPGNFVRAIFTERGAIEPVGAERIAQLATGPSSGSSAERC